MNEFETALTATMAFGVGVPALIWAMRFLFRAFLKVLRLDD